MRAGLIFTGLCVASISLVLFFQNCSGAFQTQTTKFIGTPSVEPINDDDELNRWTISSWLLFESQRLVTARFQQSLVWDIPQQITSRHNLSSDLSGTKLGVVVEKIVDGGQSYVQISTPFINTEFANTDVRIEGLAFVINDTFNPQNSTFKSISGEFFRGLPVDTMISSGGFLQEVRDLSQVNIAIAVKFIEPVSLERPQDLTLEFMGPDTITVSEGTTLNLHVSLSHALDTEDVLVRLETVTNNDAIPPDPVLRIRDREDQDILVRPPGVDFRGPLPQNPTVVAGATSAQVQVIIEHDERHETTSAEAFDIVIRNVSNTAVSLAAADRVRIVIQDDDPAAPDTEITYSDLTTQPSGPFFQHCLKCHNSVSLFGGFDVTNYNSLMASGNVIPGDSTNSSLILRLTHSNPSLRMPLDAPPLPATEIQQIRQWIDSGAKNN